MQSNQDVGGINHQGTKRTEDERRGEKQKLRS